MAVDVGQTRMKMGLHGGEHELIKVMIYPSLLCSMDIHQYTWIPLNTVRRCLAAVLINFK